MVNWSTKITQNYGWGRFKITATTITQKLRLTELRDHGNKDNKWERGKLKLNKHILLTPLIFFRDLFCTLSCSKSTSLSQLSSWLSSLLVRTSTGRSICTLLSRITDKKQVILFSRFIFWFLVSFYHLGRLSRLSSTGASWCLFPTSLKPQRPQLRHHCNQPSSLTSPSPPLKNR